MNDSLCKPDCAICGGLGWVRKDRPIYDPLFGKLEQCPAINPLVLYGSKSGLSERELRMTLKGILPINKMDSVLPIAKKIVHQGYGWIFIWGSPGLGKTTLLKTIVAECIRNRRESTYARLVDIMNDLKASFSAENKNEMFNQRLAYWINVPVLCLDELTKLKESDYVAEQRFNILDHRYQDAVNHKSITVIASNEDPRKLDPYLADRIFDGRVELIHITGISARPNMPKDSDEQVGESG